RSGWRSRRSGARRPRADRARPGQGRARRRCARLRRRGPAAAGPVAMSGRAWAEAVLEMMAVERAAARNTLVAYERDLTDAAGFLAGRGRDLSTASAEDVEAYFAALGAKGLSASTAARRR